MSQMDVVQETYQQALDATGTTMKQNEVYMSSLEAKTTALKAEFENLVISKGGLQDLAKLFVDLGTGALKLINSLGGLKTVLVLVAGAFLTLKVDSIFESFGKLSRSIIDLSSKFVLLATKIREGSIPSGKFNETLKEIGINATATQLAVGALTAVITIGVAAWGAYQASVAKTKAELEQSRQAYEQYTESLGSTIEKIQNESTSKEELIRINKDLGGSYADEKQDLIDLNTLRQENIDKLYEESKAKALEYQREHGSEHSKAENFLSSPIDDSNVLLKQLAKLQFVSSKIDFGGQSKTFSEILRNLREISKLNPEEGIKKLGDELDRLTAEEKKNGKLTEEQIVIREEYEKALKAIDEAYKEGKSSIEAWDAAEEALNQSKNDFINKNNQAVESTKKLDESTTELIEKYDLEDEAIASLISDQGLSFDEAVQLLAREKIAATGTVEAIDELSKSTSVLVSEINDLSSALNEQEKNGSISLETQLKLIDAGYAMALSYDKETGACKLDEEAVKQLVEAKLEMQIANLEIAKSSVVQTLIDEANQAVVSAGKFLELAKAKNIAAKSYFNTKGGRDITDPSLSISGYGGNHKWISQDSEAALSQVDALDKEIQALESSLKQVQKNGVKAFGSIGKAAGGAGKSTKKAGKEAEEAAKKAKKAIEDEVKALEKKQKQYERVIKWIEKQYDKEIDKIKKEKDEALDAIEAQIKAREKEKDKILDALEVEIKALKTQKDARKKYWDDQIDALKKANQAKKDSLELQEKLDALEKARNTKVKIYKEGQGFVYDVDQTEVAKAKKALDEYLSEKAYEDELARLEALRDAELDNFEQRINALEDYKDKVEENLEAQIESLEAYKEQVEAQYDAQIKIYEDAKQQFEDMVNAYEEEQDRLLALELAGINAENNNWMLRLENLQNFVSEYHSLLKQVEDAKERLDALNNQETKPTTSTASSGSSGGVSSSSGGTKKASSGGSKTYTTHADILPTVTQQSVTATKKLGTSTTTKTIADGAKSSSNPYANLFKHANGIDTIPNDEIAIVGESPNQEMVIGSKLNGKLMSLDKGTGVVNAESSKSLAGMLNQVGKFGASGFGSGGGTLNTNYNNDSLTINGVTIQGANIKDPETFVNGLLSLKSEALQRAYKHK